MNIADEFELPNGDVRVTIGYRCLDCGAYGGLQRCYNCESDNLEEVYQAYPIMMSDVMMEANIAGRKSVTRRVRNLTKVNEEPFAYAFIGMKENVAVFCKGHAQAANGEFVKIKSPYGIKGDLMWVRETWTQNGLGYYRYKADWTPTKDGVEGNGTFTNPSVPDKFRGKWKPSIHMPRAASRLLLRNEGVRIERLKDITNEECIKEGIHVRFNPLFQENRYRCYLHQGEEWREPLSSYISLWERINGVGSWEADKEKFVWVIDYSIVNKPSRNTAEGTTIISQKQ